MEYDEGKVDEMVLALLHLTLSMSKALPGHGKVTIGML